MSHIALSKFERWRQAASGIGVSPSGETSAILTSESESSIIGEVERPVVAGCRFSGAVTMDGPSQVSGPVKPGAPTGVKRATQYEVNASRIVAATA